MKKIKIISIGFVLCFLVFSSKAQTESGNILIGGDTKLDFSSLNSSWETESDNGDLGKTTYFEISPNFGFFIVRNIALGVEIPIAYSAEEEENGDKYSSTSYTFAPFLRWYIGRGSVKPYFQGQIGPGKAKMKSAPATGESDDSTVGMLFYNNVYN